MKKISIIAIAALVIIGGLKLTISAVSLYNKLAAYNNVIQAMQDQIDTVTNEAEEYYKKFINLQTDMQNQIMMVKNTADEYYTKAIDIRNQVQAQMNTIKTTIDAQYDKLVDLQDKANIMISQTLKNQIQTQIQTMKKDIDSQINKFAQIQENLQTQYSSMKARLDTCFSELTKCNVAVESLQASVLQKIADMQKKFNIFNK